MAPNKIDYPPRLRLAQLPTPLQYLPRASKRWGLGKRLWVKRDDLTGSTLTGNKVRKLEFFAAHARDNGFDTLITCGGLQSNHARATAGVCAQLGLHCHLLLRGEHAKDEGNTLLDLLFGADITVVPSERYHDALNDLLDEIAETERAHGRKPLVIPTGGSNGLGIWGYIAGAEELAGDLNHAGIERASIVAATGSGGTQAGLTLGMALQGRADPVVGVAVCDDAEWFNRKVEQDIAEARALWPQLPQASARPTTLDQYIGPGYGVADPEVYDLIAELSRLEGLVLDPVYTGKAFHGLVSELALGGLDYGDDIVFVHTGGIFGMFPHAQALRGALDRRR